MLYFDTSFLVPLFFAESTSAQIDLFIKKQQAGALAISHWTRLEFFSVLAREVRRGNLDRETALDADRRFEALVASSFVLLLPTIEDFELAKQYLRHQEARLRIGDAFHLAISRNHGATMILSLDKGMLTAGRLFGLPVRRGID
jgi:uncharacterized protein